ncbi:hypothetical protein [Sphingomonas sp. PB4P5]|uniref:hypothetical protein n=1 Tax=Parasphingomonas puruogangriensis TaxID=3096155 RepID=UPI002FCC5C20
MKQLSNLLRSSIGQDASVVARVKCLFPAAAAVSKDEYIGISIAAQADPDMNKLAVISAENAFDAVIFFLLDEPYLALFGGIGRRQQITLG